MGLIDDCQTYFGTKCIYEVLSVDKSASNAQLKKAYRKASLLTHPDKVDESQTEAATRKFQVLSRVHFILSDSEKRAVYDETGIVDDENDIGTTDTDHWNNYWRLLFPKITTKDIDNFMKKYKGSEDEIEDLKKCYLKFEGDMNAISESFIGYEYTEEENYSRILKDLIEKGEIPSFPKFVNEPVKVKTARHKKLKKESAEAEKLEMDTSDDDLIKAITKRNQEREGQFNSLIANLERKYGKEPNKKKKK